MRDAQDGLISVPVPNPSFPLLAKNLADAFASAYHQWALGALAGGMLPVGGNPSIISAQLQLLPKMTGWGTGLLAYWSAVSWNLPGVSTGVSIPVALAKIAPEIIVRLFPTDIPNSSSAQSIEEFADRLADILSSNTKLLTVSQTLLANGATSVVTVS